MNRQQLSRDFESFVTRLVQATRRIDGEYMQLPVAGQEASEYRERVYCYELYHRLRTEMDAHSFRYSLSGEIDKSGHPYIRGNNLNHVKPDLLVHKPGKMTGNLVAMEVKSVNGKKPGIKKDLRSLTAFRLTGGYHRAIYLIYGDDEGAFQRLKNKAVSLSEQHDQSELNLDCIDLYWHPRSTQPARKRAW